jgi:hypothetical protein
VFLDVADVDSSRLVFSHEVDELLFDGVHAVHAAVLDLFLVDFREVRS